MESARPISARRTPDAADRDALFDSQLQDVLGLRQPVGVEPTGPLLLVVSGDVEPEGVLRQLEAAFDDLPAGAWQVPGIAEPGQPVEIEARVAHPIAQERIGYVVRVPQPRPESAAAWQVALYVLSHGYEGRLGKQAISQQGLVYYIDSEYQTDGGNDWISLSMGVDSGKLPAVKRLLKEELVRLREDPPSEAEIEEAKEHFLGRHLSAYQSNAELVDNLTRQWIWYRDVLEYEQWQQQLAAVQRQDVLDLLPAFTRGSIIVVRNPQE